MEYNTEQLSDIFIKAENALIEQSEYDAEEFDKNYEVFKHYSNKQFTDDDYYLKMVHVAFYSGFRDSVVSERIGVIDKYFSNYIYVKDFDEKAVQQMLHDDAMIRNEKKIRACIYNAKLFHSVISKHGSFASYVALFNPDECWDNLLKLREDLKRFKFLGDITSFHFMTDIGLSVIKPDRVLVRIFMRLGLIMSRDDFFEAVTVGRKFATATGFPTRYVDMIFALYGQICKDNSKIKSICLEKKPRCTICGIIEYCEFHKGISKSPRFQL
jgi:DNA-3-methyladenine glycosylase I